VTTWIILLVFSWLGKFNDPLLLGLLIGQSILGVYYLLESVMEERYLIFRLPLLVTLIYAAYISGRFQMISINAVLLLLGLWAVFIAIYSFLTRPTWQVLGKRVIDCCKSW
jgi:hypothetical protein